MNKLVKKAFTLIELLVVIAIIGILSGLIVLSIGGMTTKATIAKAQVFSNSLRSSLMANIVSEWKFEGPTAVDSTAVSDDARDTWGSNNGTISGAPRGEGGSDCVSGKCLYFDGTDDFIDCGTNSIYNFNNQSFSIAGWLKTASTSVDIDTIVAKSDTEMTTASPKGYGLWVRYDNHRFLFKTGDGTAQQSAAGATLIGDDANWHYAVGVFNVSAGKIYLYVDGKIDGEGTINTSNLTSVTSLKIGNSTSSGGSYFKGFIDDVRVFNAAIPTSQIQEQYYSGLNSLLANGSINTTEYSERINSIAVK